MLRRPSEGLPHGKNQGGSREGEVTLLETVPRAQRASSLAVLRERLSAQFFNLASRVGELCLHRQCFLWRLRILRRFRRDGARKITEGAPAWRQDQPAACLVGANYASPSQLLAPSWSKEDMT